jgi:hypothetical protein
MEDLDIEGAELTVQQKWLYSQLTFIKLTLMANSGLPPLGRSSALRFHLYRSSQRLDTIDEQRAFRTVSRVRHVNFMRSPTLETYA